MNLFKIILFFGMIPLWSQDLLTVSVQKVTTERIAIRKTYPAELLPFRTATLAAEWSGPITAIHVDEFDPIQEGAEAALVDRSLLALQREEVQARLDFAESQYKRYQELRAQEAVTEQVFLQAKMDLFATRAQASQLSVQYEKCSIRAPWSGVVQKKWVEQGDFVSPGQPILTLVDLSQLRIHATIPAADRQEIKEGQMAQLRITGHTSPYATLISRLAPLVNPTSRTFEVECLLTPPHASVVPGLVAQLEIVAAELSDQMSIPLSALVEFEEGPGVFLFEPNQGQQPGDGRVQRQLITIGPIVGTKAIVTGGLKGSESIVVEGQSWVSDGLFVKINEESP